MSEEKEKPKCSVCGKEAFWIVSFAIKSWVSDEVTSYERLACDHHRLEVEKYMHEWHKGKR